MAEKSQLLFLPYIQLMRDKEEVIRKLEFLLTSNQREFSLSINQAALLFLIDCDNLNGGPYPEDFERNINFLVHEYCKNTKQNVIMTKEEVLKIIESRCSCRVSSEINEMIALRYAKLYNAHISNVYSKLSLDVIEKVCKSISDN